MGSGGRGPAGEGGSGGGRGGAEDRRSRSTGHLDLDDSLKIDTIDLDVATGIAKLDGETVRILHVLAANEFTIPLTYETTAEDALRLAAAIIEWDVGMMEAADAPVLH